MNTTTGAQESADKFRVTEKTVLLSPALQDMTHQADALASGNVKCEVYECLVDILNQNSSAIL